MEVDRGRFLLLVSTLAAGGAAGYVISERDGAHVQSTPIAQPVMTPEPTQLELPATTELTSAEAQHAVKSACDDSVGEPGACPAGSFPTATEEGGCGNLAAVRCADFKRTMKPRVAQTAVACLNKLSAAERCDPRRVQLCAHNALMNACDDSDAPTVTKSCDAIVSTCSGASMKECRMALSGLKEIGREAATECATKHCNDKGIVGCEATSIIALQNAPQK